LQVEKGDTLYADNRSISLFCPLTICSDWNQNPVVLQLSYREVDFLFTGDLKGSTERGDVVHSLSTKPVGYGGWGSGAAAHGVLHSTIPEEGRSMKREPEGKKPGKSLLQELCGADEALYALLSSYLYYSPLAAIPKKDLDSLLVEAERTGDYRQAIDKAIFEATQKSGQREQSIEAMRRIVSQAIHAAEQAREKLEKDGVSEHAASMGRKIEEYRFMIERAADILTVASGFYEERLIESEENIREEARDDERRKTERNEEVVREREARERTARKQERKRMGRRERREAKRQAQIDDAAAEERRKSREEKRSQMEREEERIEEEERASREARKKDRERN